MSNQPAPGHHAALLHRRAVGHRRVERVEEAVVGIEVRAVARVNRERRRRPRPPARTAASRAPPWARACRRRAPRPWRGAARGVAPERRRAGRSPAPRRRGRRTRSVPRRPCRSRSSPRGSRRRTRAARASRAASSRSSRSRSRAMTSSVMPRKSIHTCEYWWPNSGAKLTWRLAAVLADAAASAVYASPRVGRAAGAWASRGRARRGSSTRRRSATRRRRSPTSGRQPMLTIGRPRRRPVPVDARVDALGEVADLALVGVRRRRSTTGRTARRPSSSVVSIVDSSTFGEDAHAGLHVEEVVEEAAVAGACLRAPGPAARASKKRSVASTRARRLGAGDVAALDADRIGGEREAHRRDARGRVARVAVGHEAVRGIAQLPEEAEGARLDVVEKRRQRSPGPGAGAAVARLAGGWRRTAASAPRRRENRPRRAPRPRRSDVRRARPLQNRYDDAELQAPLRGPRVFGLPKFALTSGSVGMNAVVAGEVVRVEQVEDLRRSTRTPGARRSGTACRGAGRRSCRRRCRRAGRHRAGSACSLMPNRRG